MHFEVDWVYIPFLFFLLYSDGLPISFGNGTLVLKARSYRWLIITFAAFLTANWLSSLWAETLHFNNVWMVQTGYADLDADKHWFTQADVHIRVNESGDLFRQNLNTLRLGRRLNQHLSYAVGFGFVPTQLLTRFVNEQRVWQQLGYQYRFNDNSQLNLYSRFENRWVAEAAGISLRQRLKVVLKHCLVQSGVCPYLASETFINYNFVGWDPSRTLSQQRSDLGIEKNLSQAVKVRVGYMNQLIRLRQNLNLSTDIVDIQIAFNFS